MRSIIFSSVCAAALLAFLPSCASLTPKVKTVWTEGLSGFDLVYFTFGEGWSAAHPMTGVLQQEFERRGFVVLLQEPTETLWPRTLRLRLDVVEDHWRKRMDGSDHVGRMGFRLERMTDGKEVGWAIYKGVGLDPIEQRDLAKGVVFELLKRS